LSVCSSIFVQIKFNRGEGNRAVSSSKERFFVTIKKSVGERRARSKKQLGVAFYKLRSNLSFCVGAMPNKSVVWDYQISKYCVYGKTQPQPECQTGTKNVKIMFRNAAVFSKILNFFFIKIEYDLYVLDRFDVLMSKMIFKK